MRFVLLIILVSIGVSGLAAGLMILVGERKRRALVAGAPPGALVQRTDSMAEVKAKRAVYDKYMEGVRLLSEVQLADQHLTFLPGELRRKIDEHIEGSYAN